MSKTEINADSGCLWIVVLIVLAGSCAACDTRDEINDLNKKVDNLTEKVEQLNCQ